MAAEWGTCLRSWSHMYMDCNKEYFFRKILVAKGITVYLSHISDFSMSPQPTQWQSANHNLCCLQRDCSWRQLKWFGKGYLSQVIYFLDEISSFWVENEILETCPSYWAARKIIVCMRASPWKGARNETRTLWISSWDEFSAVRNFVVSFRSSRPVLLTWTQTLEITAISRCSDEFSINLKFSWSLGWFAYKISKERKDEEQVQYRSYGVQKVRIFHGMTKTKTRERLGLGGKWN